MLLAPSSAKASAELRKAQAFVAEPAVVFFSKFKGNGSEGLGKHDAVEEPGVRLMHPCIFQGTSDTDDGPKFNFLLFFVLQPNELKCSKSVRRQNRLGTLNHPHSRKWHNGTSTKVLVWPGRCNHFTITKVFPSTFIHTLIILTEHNATSTN